MELTLVAATLLLSFVLHPLGNSPLFVSTLNTVELACRLGGPGEHRKVALTTAAALG